MSYLPALCDACKSVLLYSEQSASGRRMQCSRCREMPRVIPSRSYSVHDVETFAELSETVGGTVSPLEAYHLSIELESALAAGKLDRVLEPLVRRWPGLLPLFVVIGANIGRQRHSLQMLKTIFDGLSLTNSGATPSRTVA
jgi:hypothetical protein